MTIFQHLFHNLQPRAQENKFIPLLDTKLQTTYSKQFRGTNPQILFMYARQKERNTSSKTGDEGDFTT